jgi:tRNA-dihydrouridine synthase A
VHRLKQDFPQLLIEINGGFTTLAQVCDQLQSVDAVMIGRAAYDNPYLFASSDRVLYGEQATPLSRREVAEAMLPYIDAWVSKGLKLNKITRHMLQLFSSQPGSRLWKQILTEKSCLPGAGTDVVQQALALLDQHTLQAQEMVGKGFLNP